MTYTKILYDVADDIAQIRLNDSATLNAMSRAMGEEFLDALGRSEREARALLIGATGRTFCAGANLGDDMMDVASERPDMGATLEAIFNPLVERMRDLSVPIVASVRGAVVGVGCSIALASDLVVADETAFFVQAFRNVGLVPDAGSTFLLARAVGKPRAMELMLLGERLPARSALEWGLINRLVDAGDLDSASLAIAGQLAKGPKSLGIIRKTVWQALDIPFKAALGVERAAQYEAGLTRDFKEGVSAFREKRVAKFRGE